MELERISHALWLAAQAGDVLDYYWPITLGSAAVLALGVALAVRRHRSIAFARIWLVPLATGPVLLVLLGTLLERSAEGTRGLHPAVLTVWAVALLNIPLVCYLAYRSRSNLMFAIGAAVSSLWLTASAWVPAVMSVTGDWL